MNAAMNAITTEVTKAVTAEIINQLKTGEIVNSIIKDDNKLFHPHISKEFWIGNYNVKFNFRA